ncbi:hypothetical protein RYZ20_03485 [Thioclava sp. A2]|uniref:hypothetical protein n=1 Tax=Thioclava sp. FCG-A2 TaxID=3080562 RepID=UPI002954DB26|nr:hypothetical protein [Thioclava sp. A2]MDV7269958.1 hypothetical protein [Thioclava sp. A2]
MTPARPSTPVFIALALLAGVLALELTHATLTRRADAARLAQEADITRALGLTDIALFTEARYTRHPSLADLNTPFQDHPAGFDHFPSGTLMPRPDIPPQTALGLTPEEISR